ncbi:hypothetical protein CHRYSEOSP005_16880 [Chryseobacterium sp. Alg-005]|uniref:hypothetical protein n=1 Tax=Chryseobacterium sp. Alg-005 TaxID=3159516 RepID=UPI00355568F4
MKTLKKISRHHLKDVYGAGPVQPSPCNCFCYINGTKTWNACNQYCPGGEVIPGVEPGNHPNCSYKLPL